MPLQFVLVSLTCSAIEGKEAESERAMKPIAHPHSYFAGQCAKCGHDIESQSPSCKCVFCGTAYWIEWPAGEPSYMGRTTDELIAELGRLDRERDRLARAIELKRDALTALRSTA